MPASILDAEVCANVVKQDKKSQNNVFDSLDTDFIFMLKMEIIAERSDSEQ